MRAKVLLATTINIVKEYCLYDWLDRIKELSYPVDVFLVDNSPNPAFSEKIRSMGYDCVHEAPGKREARVFMASSLQRCQVKFLAGEYTHLFSLECDIFPPLDIIERLLEHDLDVVGATYWTEHGYNTRLQLRLIYQHRIDYKKRIKEYKPRFLTFGEAQQFMDGKVKPIYASGIGCVLIKRNILEEFKFRVDMEDVGFADSYFHTDLWRAGVENFVDTSILPLHRNSNWDAVPSDMSHKKILSQRGDLELKK